MDIIALGHREFAKGKTRWNTLNLLLEKLNELMGAGYGFFGRLQNAPENQQVRKSVQGNVVSCIFASAAQGLSERMRI